MPDAAFTDATAGLLLLQVPPVLPVLLSTVDRPVHIDPAPFMVPGLATGLTVTRCEAVAVPQPLEEVTVYMIVLLPGATPVTTPVAGSTVATPVVVLDHTPPLLPLASRLMV